MTHKGTVIGVLDLEHTHSIVLGSDTLERYREAIDAAALAPLGAAQRAKIDRLVETLQEPERR